MKTFVEKATTAAQALLTRRIKLQFDGIAYEYRNVPTKKLLNWLLTEMSAHFQVKTTWTMPTHLQIEPSSICNLRCSFCPVTTGMDRDTGLMEMATFQKALQQLSDNLLLVYFWVWGEPFLNPHIFEMISEVKKYDIRVVSSTNGHVFTNAKKAEQLVRSGIDTIIFAVDGLCQETYEKYRKGGNIQQVLKGLRNVVSAKKANGTGYPLINLRLIGMKHNEHEIKNLEAFAGSLGVDVISVKTVNPYDGDGCSSGKADGLEFIPSNPAYQRFEYDLNTGKRLRLAKNPCKRLWNDPAIHWDGKISPCDFDPHNKHSLGDLKKQTFDEIWYGKKASNLRRWFSKDYQTVPVCSHCTYAFKGGACATETIASIKFIK